MSDDTAISNESDPNGIANQQEKVYSDNKDWLLEQIVSIVNYTGMQIGITLNLSGSVVSGIAISGKTYITEMAARLEAENPPFNENSPTFSSVLADALRGFEPLMPPFEEAKEGFMHENPNYLHLKSAETFVGGGTVIPARGATYFRCRISEISGFSLGTLARQD